MPHVTSRFAGHTVIVTGAARGLGRGIAEAFIDEGASVLLADINEQLLKRTVAELSPDGRDVARAVAVNVADSADIERMVEVALQWRGQVDHLVNNAGIVRIASLISTSDSDWDQVIDVNLKGVFMGMRAVLPHMVKRESGSVVNIASQAGKRGNQFISPYCASKAGVISLTQTAALEVAPHVRVNCVCPGFINTELQEEEYDIVAAITGEDRETIKAGWLAEMPLGRFQQVGDVADSVLFLSSSAASQTTGEALNISGGMVMD
jgi:NAD(P)-dependent dehydrogenase (short-subunit alcohol dehydrogenase family)